MSRWKVTNGTKPKTNTGGQAQTRRADEEQDDLLGKAIRQGYGQNAGGASSAAAAQTTAPSAAGRDSSPAAQNDRTGNGSGSTGASTPVESRWRSMTEHGRREMASENRRQRAEERRTRGSAHYFSDRAAQQQAATPSRTNFERDDRLQSAVMDAASQRAEAEWSAIQKKSGAANQAANDQINRAAAQMNAAAASMDASAKAYENSGSQADYNAYYAAQTEYEAAYQDYADAVRRYNRKMWQMQPEFDAYNQSVSDAQKAYGNLRQNYLEAPKETMPTNSELERTARGHRELLQQAKEGLDADHGWKEFFEAERDPNNPVNYDYAAHEAAYQSVMQREQAAQDAYENAVRDSARSQAALNERNDMYWQWKIASAVAGAESDPSYQDKVRTGREKWRRDQTAEFNAAFENEYGVSREEWLRDRGMLREGETDYGPHLTNKDALTSFSDETLTADQMDMFYALYAEDPVLAERYARDIARNLDLQKLQEDAAWAGKNPFTRAAALASGANITLLAGLDPYGDFGQKLTEYGQNLLQGGAEGLREHGILNTGWNPKVSEAVPFVGGKDMADLYQLGSSMIQSGETALLALATGGAGAFAGTALMGSSAAAADYKEMRERGVDDRTAKLHATAAGIAEALFEYVSIDKLVNQDAVASFLQNFFVQGGVEASEEVCTSIANRITDAIISHSNGYDSSVENRRNELIAQGMSFQDASMQASDEWYKELIQDAVGGFISGGMMTAGNYVFNAAVGGIQNAIESTRAEEPLHNLALKQENASKAAYAGLVTNAESAQALAKYAGDNGIKAPKQLTVQEQADSSAAPQNDKNEVPQNDSNERGRQVAGATQNDKNVQKTGEAVRAVAESIGEQMSGKSLPEMQTAYSQVVEQYGEGIKNAADVALYQATQEKISDAKTVQELAERHLDELQTVQDPDARAVMQTAYQDTAQLLQLREMLDTSSALRAPSPQGEGFSGRQYSGEAVDLRASYTQDGQTVESEIQRIDDSGRAVLANGETRSINSLQMDAEAKDLLQRLTGAVQGEEANTMLALYQEAVKNGTVSDGYDMLASALTVYENAVRGVSFENASRNAGALSAEFVRAVYDMGQKAGRDYAKVRQGTVDKLRGKGGFSTTGATGRKGSVNLDGIKWNSLTKLQKQQITTAARFAEALGVEIEFFESKSRGGRYVGEQGSYVDGKIRLDVNAGANYTTSLKDGVLKTMSHELTHFIEDYSPALYDELKSAVFDILNEEHGSDWVDGLIREKIDRSSGKLSRTGAEAEVVADGCELLLGTSKTAQEAVAQFAQEHRTAFQKMVDWLKKFAARVRELIGQTTRAEAQDILKHLDRVQELWDKALADAVQAHDEIGDDVARIGASEQMAEEAAIRNSDRIDEDTLEFLNNQEHVKVYRAMQLIDGKLYPPMAAKIKGADGKLHLVDATELGKWYQAEERPDLVKNGKFILNKGNGTNVPAAYNPYFHASASPLNDQFTSAYKRPNLVVVEGIIPSSELTSGYKAEGAKNSVGETSWHAGPVASKLKGEKARRVFLSRWFQATRIMSDAEVAGIVANTLQGENVKVPSNVVTPGLLAELEKHGVPIENKNTTQKDGAKYSERDEIQARYAGNALATNRTLFDYDFLTSLPEMVVYEAPPLSSVKVDGHVSQEKAVELGMKNVQEVGNLQPNGNYAVKNRYTGRDVSVGGNALDHSLDSKDVPRLRTNARLSSIAGYIIQNGLPINALKNTNSQAENTYALAALVGSGDKDIVAIVTVEQYTGNLVDIDFYDVAHAVNGRIKKGDSWSATRATEHSPGSTISKISIADFLDIVNTTHRSILSDDVLSHYNEQRPENGHYTDRVKFSERDYDTPSDVELLMGLSEEDAAKGEQRQMLKEFQQKERKIESLQKRLESQQKQIRGLKSELNSRTKELGKTGHKLQMAEIRERSERFGRRMDELRAQKQLLQTQKAAAEQKQMSETALQAQIREKEAIARDLEKQIAREKDILAGKLKPLEMQRLLKAEREKASQAMRTKKEQQFAGYKERQEASRLRGRLKNLADDIKRTMLHPTDGRYVPASLFESMAKLTDVLAVEPRPGTKAAERYRVVQEAIHKMEDAYAGLKDADVDFAYKTEFNEDVAAEIREIRSRFEETSFREMSVEELKEVYELVRSVNLAMKSATRMMSSTRYKSIFEAAQAVAGQQRSMDSFNRIRASEQSKRLRLLDNLSVMRAVEMMSGWDRNSALYQLMHGIEQGVVEADGWVMNYNKAMQGLKTGKNEKAYRDALNKKLDYGVKDAEGLDVKMTKLQALQILMTAEREAHNEKLVHLQKGGAVIRDLSNPKKPKSQTIQVTPELLQSIRDSLTAWDKAYMQAVRDYFAKEGKAAGRITYQLKHRAMETEQYYVPYSVDKNYLDTKLDEDGTMTSLWVRTPGSTKPLEQNASQPVIIDGLDTVMGRHVQEMANYIGLAMPVRDFSKVYNARLSQGEGVKALPVKQTIFDNFGEKGQNLLTQAVMDVQGATGRGNTWSSGIAEHLNGLYSAFVKSALLINPSVTIKQAASYVAAESVLSHRALIAGNRPIFSSTDQGHSVSLIAQLFASPEGKTAQRLYDEIDRHTSMHYQRRQGMSYEELARVQDSQLLPRAVSQKLGDIGASMEQTKLGHAVRKAGQNLNPVTWIQRMDVATTAALWVAAKEQARMDLGSGSSPAAQNDNSENAAYWQHVTELYEQALRETQPMYDGLHRNAHQKQSGGLMQYLFPFRTVPIQNHGQLASAYEAFKAAKGKSKAEQKAAAKHLAKTVWAQTESAVVFSMMTFLAAAFKRKTKKYRDEDEEFTLASIGKGIGLDVLNTWASVLLPMYGSEMYDYIDRSIDAAMGKSSWSFDTFSVGVVDMANDLISGSDKFLGEFGKLMRGESKDGTALWKAAVNLMLKGGKLAGIPADTIKTYAEGIKDNIADIMEGRIPAINNEAVDRSSAVNAGRFLKAWQAGDSEKQTAVFEEMVQDKMDGGKSREDAEKAASEAIREKVKEDYLAGDLSREQAEAALQLNGAKDADEAFWYVEQWTREQQHDDDPEYKFSKYEDLDAALSSGEGVEEAWQVLTEHGVSDETVAKHVSSYLKEKVQSGEMDADTAVDALVQYAGKEEDKAYWTVQEWEGIAAHDADEDYNFSKYDALREAIDANKDPAEAVQELLDHGTAEKDIISTAKKYILEQYEAGKYSEEKLRNYLSRYCGITDRDTVDKLVNNANCYRETGVHYNDLKDAYQNGEITEKAAQNALKKYGGFTDLEAENRVRYWQFQQDYPDADLSEEALAKYYNTKPDNYGKTMKEAGISLGVYVGYCNRIKNCKGEDKNGDGKTDSGSKKKQIMAEIDKLPISKEQKDALYYLNGWSAKTINEAPWR